MEHLKIAAKHQIGGSVARVVLTAFSLFALSVFLFVITGVVSIPLNSTAQAAEVDIPASSADIAAVANISTTLHLPQVSNLPQLATRMGVARASNPVDSFADFPSLRTGWYLDWRAALNPVRPNGMEYAQMVRLHQDLECPIGTSPNRVTCPYVVPHSYSYTPNEADITKIALANPGSLWILGNEIDRRDWYGSHQDEMLPELYAVAFHELQALIRGVDPAARIAIAGIVQPTPLRFEYLTKVWDEYLRLYGEPMPVDVWNTHAFVLREVLNSWGASVPPGSTATVGAHDYGPLPHPQHIDMGIFDDQIRAYRQWMKDRGQQGKPLIITEFGVLYLNSMIGVPDDDPKATIKFMNDSFDYLLNTADCSIGYGADGCRLVQRWVWYSLDDTSQFNEYSYLFDPKTKQITETGKSFRAFSLKNMTQLAKSPY